MGTPEYPKYHRQRYILAMLDLADKSLSKMDLQKLLFLAQHETSAKHYDFVPYQYGCYSFQAAADIERLESLGWLDIKKKTVSLKHPMHWGSLIENEGRELWQLMARYKDIRGRDLVKTVYDRFPFYAVNSLIVDSVAADETKEKIKQIKTEVATAQPTLFTIGYEGLSFEAYVNKLIKRGVRLLCDVRKNPLSRKFGFSKSSLSILLPKLGIEYVHVPELGIVSDKRRQLNTERDYRLLFDEYESELPKKTKHLSGVIELLNEHGQVALTCFERHHRSCHRHCVSGYLERGGGINVVHL